MTSSAAGLPRARQVRRRRRIVNQSLDVLAGWGYEEIEVPLLLPFDELRSAVGENVARQLFRFVDRDGEMLVLRGDLTPIVAWQLARGLPDRTLPLRVAYANRIARVQRAFAHEQRESYVLGMELIGVSGPSGDLEVLTIAADVLASLGVEGIEVQLGHTGLVDASVAAITDDRTLRAELVEAVGARDRAAALLLARRAPSAARDRVARLCEMAPGPALLQTLLDDPDDTIARPAHELASLYQAVQHLGLALVTQLDLTARNERGYYTGPRFRLLAPGGGEILGAGGRYDRLFRHFGVDVPASGFGLRVDRLVALPTAVRDVGDPPERYDLSAIDDPIATLRLALATRRAGGAVAVRHPSESGS